MNRNFYLKTQKENQNNHTEKSNSYFCPREPCLTQKKVRVNCREKICSNPAHQQSLLIWGSKKRGSIVLFDLVHERGTMDQVYFSFDGPGTQYSPRNKFGVVPNPLSPFSLLPFPRH